MLGNRSFQVINYMNSKDPLLVLNINCMTLNSWILDPSFSLSISPFYGCRGKFVLMHLLGLQVFVYSDYKSLFTRTIIVCLTIILCLLGLYLDYKSLCLDNSEDFVLPLEFWLQKTWACNHKKELLSYIYIYIYAFSSFKYSHSHSRSSL